MSKTTSAQRGQARTKRPVRNQVEFHWHSIDQLVEAGHRVRVVWEYTESLDLSDLYAEIKAVEGSAGRDAIDPQVLFALWLFGTIEGVGSARRLYALTVRDIPYKWICGGVSVNHHSVSDFRTAHGDLLERIMVDSIAVLLSQDLISLDRVAQDGMRVRAHAGSSSFRRQGKLEESLRIAKEHVEEVKSEHEDDPSGGDCRRTAARKRAAQERYDKLKKAKEELEKLHEKRNKRRGTPTAEPRASTTDPEARRMKMPDNGFRPAFNVQFATEGSSRVIVGVSVTNQGTDNGQMAPMHDYVVTTYNKTPKEYLVDGGFTKVQDVTDVERRGTQCYGPLPREKKQLEDGKDPYAKKPGDTPEMAAFRKRMGTDEAKEIYKARSSIAEFPNAECRNRGLTQFRVRGLIKTKAQALWHVLAFNFLRFKQLEFLDPVMAGG